LPVNPPAPRPPHPHHHHENYKGEHVAKEIIGLFTPLLLSCGHTGYFHLG
jgi:hypothetical protein